MKYESRSSATPRGGARAGGESAGMETTMTATSTAGKQSQAPDWAVESESVRKVMGGAAQQVLNASGHAEDRGFLHEVKRPDSRRDFDNLTRLIWHARKSGNVHAVSDAIRVYELATAPAIEDVCAIDLHLAEEAAEAALDQAQLLALQDNHCPARAAGIVENARQLIRQASRLVDYYARRMNVARRHA